MGINEIIETRNLGPAEAARQIGITRQSLYRVRKGLPAGRVVARKISEWADHAISEESVIMGKAAASDQLHGLVSKRNLLSSGDSL